MSIGIEQSKTPGKQAFVDALDIQQDKNGRWHICGDVKGNVEGDIEGDVWGNILGDVEGHVLGKILKNET